MQCMISDETPFAHNGCSQILQYMPMVKNAAVDRRPVRSKYGETGALFGQAAEDEAGIGAAEAE
jgi:hypothetical protein